MQETPKWMERRTPSKGIWTLHYCSGTAVWTMWMMWNHIFCFVAPVLFSFVVDGSFSFCVYPLWYSLCVHSKTSWIRLDPFWCLYSSNTSQRETDRLHHHRVHFALFVLECSLWNDAVSPVFYPFFSTRSNISDLVLEYYNTASLNIILFLCKKN